MFDRAHSCFYNTLLHDHRSFDLFKGVQNDRQDERSLRSYTIPLVNTLLYHRPYPPLYPFCRSLLTR